MYEINKNQLNKSNESKESKESKPSHHLNQTMKNVLNIILFVVSLSVFYVELSYNKESLNLFKSLIHNKFFIVCFIIIFIFSHFILSSNNLHFLNKLQSEKLFSAVKHALIALFIAIFAYIQVLVSPFIFIFFMFYFYHLE